MNQIKKISQKLQDYGKVFVSREVLERLIALAAPSYTITMLCRKKIISPIKRGGDMYINALSKEFQDPYQTIGYYFGQKKAVFGGLGLYNQYGFSTQLVEWSTVYNTSVSGMRIIGKNKYIFSRQRESFFYGIIERSNMHGSYMVLSPERAIIQLLREGKKIISLPVNIDPTVLFNMAQQYASKKIFQKVEKLCT